MSGVYTIDTIPASELVHGDIFQDEYATAYRFKANHGTWVAGVPINRGGIAEFSPDHEVYRIKPIDLEPAEETAKQMGGVPPVWTEDPIVVLLYLIVRDHLGAGIIEGLVTEMANNLPVSLTNRYLAFYADNVAERLRTEGDNDLAALAKEA